VAQDRGKDNPYTERNMITVQPVENFKQRKAGIGKRLKEPALLLGQKQLGMSDKRGMDIDNNRDYR